MTVAASMPATTVAPIETRLAAPAPCVSTSGTEPRMKAIAVIAAVSPDLLREPAFRLADLGLSGLFSGVFVGKFAVYAGKYLAASRAPA